MSFTDQDLKNALRPLAGDPAETARRVLAALPPGAPPAASPRSPWRWLLPVLALVIGFAAGFLLAAALVPKAEPFVFKPDPREPIDPRVTCSLGETELWSQRVKGGTRVRTGESVRPDDFIHTSARSLLSLRLSDRWELKLDEATSLQIRDDGDLMLKEGGLWLSGKGKEAVVITAAYGARVSTHGAELLCISGADGLRVLVRNGEATIATDSEPTPRKVVAGKLGFARKGKLEAVIEAPANELAPAWVDVLRAEEGDREPLDRRVRQLIAKLGRTKENLPEALLHRIGVSAVPTLLDVITSGDFGKELDRRQLAMQVVADLADARSLAALFELLLDDDAKVRVLAVHVIARVTGVASEWEERSWVGNPIEERKKMRAEWQARIEKLK